jgi:hypothetical protein
VKLNINGYKHIIIIHVFKRELSYLLIEKMNIKAFYRKECDHSEIDRYAMTPRLGAK